MLPLIGFVIGIVLGGFFIEYNIPPQYSKYVAVAILASMDSVFGGIAANVQKKFDMRIFLSGFFGNSLLAAILVYIGDHLGLDIYVAAIFTFVYRLFLNFAIIRRFLLNKYSKKDNIIKKDRKSVV